MSTPTTVSALGIWDEGSDGLGASHEVGLWDSSKSLLVSTIVNNDSHAVDSSNTAGRWLFTYITPKTLAAGTYYLAGVYNRDSDDKFRGTADTTVTAPGLAYNQNQLAFGDLVFLSNHFDGRGMAYFGPNLLIGSVPEPSSLTICGLVGLVGLGYARRRTKRVATA